MMIQLTPRLRAVADLVPPSSSMADIGTDHAYLPVVLVQQGIVLKAVASDIHKGPSERAAAHVRKAGMSHAVSVRTGAGLLPLEPGEVEGAVMAGMGGLMMIRILEEGAAAAASLKWLVLQPQNHAAELRRWLVGNGWRISQESLAQEGRQLYQMFRAEKGTMPPFNGVLAETGDPRLRTGDPLFPELLERLIQKRRYVIEGIGAHTDDAGHAEKRRTAVREKEELEAMICRYTQEI